jgi:hypothetical protein
MQHLNKYFSPGDIVKHSSSSLRYYLVHIQYKDLILLEDEDWTASRRYFELITDIFCEI